MEREHPKYQMPDTPHAQYLYNSALKHAKAAKEKGKSTEEVHAIFHKIVSRNLDDVSTIPTDEDHSKYRSAVVHMKKAMEKGKTSQEAHQVFKNIMSGTSKGHH